MSQPDTLVRPTDDSNPTAGDERGEGVGTGAIPPAFYRDAGRPPPSDPHWREWPDWGNREPVPRFLLIGLPILLGVLGVLHILLILVVMRLSGLY